MSPPRVRVRVCVWTALLLRLRLPRPRAAHPPHHVRRDGHRPLLLPALQRAPTHRPSMAHTALRWPSSSPTSSSATCAHTPP
eukprot:1333111-Prymnesium_polylepis.1